MSARMSSEPETPTTVIVTARTRRGSAAMSTIGGMMAVTIASQTVDCRDVFVYFKHEEEGKGPEFARLLQEILQNSPMVRKP